MWTRNRWRRLSSTLCIAALAGVTMMGCGTARETSTMPSPSSTMPSPSSTMPSPASPSERSATSPKQDLQGSRVPGQRASSRSARPPTTSQDTQPTHSPTTSAEPTTPPADPPEIPRDTQTTSSPSTSAEPTTPPTDPPETPKTVPPSTGADGPAGEEETRIHPTQNETIPPGEGLACATCISIGQGGGIDWIIPRSVAPPEGSYNDAEKDDWLEESGTKLGNRISAGFTNIGKRPVQVDSIQAHVIDRIKLPEGYCVRSYPKGGAGSNLPITFELTQDVSWGMPATDPQDGSTWTYPLTIMPGEHIHFTSLDSVAHFDIGFYMTISFRVDGIPGQLPIGAKSAPHRTSSCKDIEKRYHWVGAGTGPNAEELYALKELIKPWNPDPYKDW